MKVQWYVYSNQVVTGPYSTENVEEGMDTHKWSLDALVWRKGQRDWLSLKLWKENLDVILENLEANVEKTVWYVDHDGYQHGPMNTENLQKYMSDKGILTKAKVWTVGMHKWMSIFEVPDLLKVLPITRRKYARAPIKGSVELKRNNQKFSANLEFIGEGGIGIKNSTALSKGELFDVTISSPMLITPIHAKAVVMNATEQGTAGFRFVQLHSEPQSTIVSFVKQFQS